MKKRILYFLIVFCCIAFVAYEQRQRFFSAIGNFLIVEQPLESADAMVVLSGNAFDRGNEGARILQTIKVKEIICPGGNLEPLFLILGDSVYESEMCKKNLIRNGVDSSMITALRYGTSTLEEADTVLAYCHQKHYQKLIVVSSLFHTRRANKVYQQKAEKHTIKTISRGAKSFQYDEQKWWQSENGLIALNNEYIKLFYYFFKK